MTKPTSAPADAELPLLPTSLAFVCAGAVAAFAANVYVSIDDLTRLYEDMGVELPGVVQLLLTYPVGVPAVLLAGAVVILAGPRVQLPRSLLTEFGQRTASLGAVLFTACTAFLAYSHSIVFQELQAMLQQ